MFKTVKNIIKWWPILKEDADWDYDFLLQVIRHKLNNMADFFESENAVSADAVEEAKAMRLCIGHLDRLIADDFFDYDALEADYGEDCFDLQSRMHEEEAFKKACEAEATARQNTLDNFLQIFKARIFNWWD